MKRLQLTLTKVSLLQAPRMVALVPKKLELNHKRNKQAKPLQALKQRNINQDLNLTHS